MPHCLHLLDAYLPRTETFIWQALRRAQRFPPLILADAWENLEQFPLPHGKFLRLHPQRPWWQRVQARLGGTYAPVHYREGVSLPAFREAALCHAHKGFRACVTADFAAALGKPWVISFYGSDVSQVAHLRRARSGYQKIFRQARFLFAEGPALRERLIGLGAPPEKIRIQRIALDLSEYSWRERTWDGHREIRILFVGRLVEKKGLAIGLQALADKRLDLPWKLSVVGDGTLRPALEAQAQRLGIKDRVDFLGYRTLVEMRQLMDSHDLLLQPSMTAKDGDGEGGAPTVILEAQACGMPIISTRHDDIPYVTDPDHSAWLGPEGDAGALTHLLLRAVSETDRWAKMGQAGRLKVEADHDISQEILALEKIYAEALG